MESELFGHVRGAFTGAVANRTGRFEAANGGTVFLDEINSTSLTLQVKLLRVLQEREFERVGDTSTLSTDARIVAASNRDLMQEVREERFREDLYWRLNVVPIEIPPLRRRREDIPSLVSFFLEHYNEVNDRYVVHIGPGTMEALQDYHWPGNVRELQNYIERAVVMADTDELTLELLPNCVVSRQLPEGVSLPRGDFDSLTREVVMRGLGRIQRRARRHSFRDCRTDRERTDQSSPGLLWWRSDQSGNQAWNQSQYAPQEDQGLQARR